MHIHRGCSATFPRDYNYNVPMKTIITQLKKTKKVVLGLYIINKTNVQCDNELINQTTNNDNEYKSALT